MRKLLAKAKKMFENAADWLGPLSEYVVLFGSLIIAMAGILAWRANTVLKDRADARNQANETRVKELEVAKLETERLLEEEKIARLKLQEAVAPRKIEQELAATALRRFAGTIVYLTWENDHEAITTANQLRFLFHVAGWRVRSMALTDIFPREGIHVESKGWTPDGDLSRTAAELLVKQLEAMKHEVVYRPSANARNEVNAFSVHVGRKPTIQTEFGTRMFGNQLLSDPPEPQTPPPNTEPNKKGP